MSDVEMKSVESSIVELWQAIKQDIDAAEHDVAKSARGVRAAGPRVRKLLRPLRDKLTALVKLTISHEKALAQVQTEKK